MEEIKKISTNDYTLDQILSQATMHGKVLLCDGQNEFLVSMQKKNEPIVVLTEDEKIDIVAQRILKKNKRAFEELGK